MKVLVLGGTGPTGRHLLTDLRAAGHDVTALIRTPGQLESETGLRLVRGDATTPEDVTRAAQGQHAIVSTLGAGKNLRSGTLFTDAADAALKAAAAAGIDRIIWLSSFGVGETFSSASRAQKLIYRTLLRSLYADKKVADQAIRRSGRDWTLVYPTRLMDGPRTADYLSAEDLPMRGNPTVSRADVAHFIASTLVDDEWEGRAAVVTGR